LGEDRGDSKKRGEGKTSPEQKKRKDCVKQQLRKDQFLWVPPQEGGAARGKNLLDWVCTGQNCEVPGLGKK